jgi:hypothetical protein
VSQEPQTESGPGQLGLREIGADAVGYWERRRLIYNGILILIVGWYFVAGLPSSREHAGFNLFLVLLVLGVVANVLYCLAYVADVFVQLSAVRHAWLRWRWVLFVIGTATAVIMTRFFVMGAFSTWRGH